VRNILFVAVLTLSAFAHAQDKIKMLFNNEDIVKIIEIYSKASGQKFVIDSSVRGKVTLLIQEPVTLEEAFNHMSSALAVNGYAISKQGDTMIVKSARNIQRDMIEVSTEKPALKPERMYTWIYQFKNISAESVMGDVRVLSSKDGEYTVTKKTNQLIITDWTSSLNRVSDLLKEIDRAVDPAVAKIIEASKKERDPKRKEQATKENEAASSTKQ
jgi:type II secretory pathway component GspD/PulD (secretin)